MKKKLLFALLMLLGTTSCSTPQRVYSFGDVAQYNDYSLSINQDSTNEEFIVIVSELKNSFMFDFKIFGNYTAHTIGEGKLKYYCDGVQIKIEKEYMIIKDCTIIIKYSDISKDEQMIIESNDFYLETCNYSWNPSIR